jgi:hypothetical protein
MISKHSFYLDELVNHLSSIDEYKTEISWIFKEGIWYQNRSSNLRSLCDLILVRYDRTAVPIELKGSRQKRHKALSQMEQGKYFIENELQMKCNYGKFVVYTRNTYVHETINYR